MCVVVVGQSVDYLLLPTHEGNRDILRELLLEHKRKTTEEAKQRTPQILKELEQVVSLLLLCGGVCVCAWLRAWLRL